MKLINSIISKKFVHLLSDFEGGMPLKGLLNIRCLMLLSKNAIDDTDWLAANVASKVMLSTRTES